MKLVSMLRGINVSGKNMVKMEQLRSLYESLGFKNVETYLQSGNVVFDSTESNSPNLAAKIEKKIRQSMNLYIPTFIRSKEDILKLVKNMPFDGLDTSKIYVTFLSEKTANAPIDEINKARSKNEEFSFFGKEIYLLCPNGYGNTKLSNNFFERKLKVVATTRNWNTVNALLSMAEKRK